MARVLRTMAWVALLAGGTSACTDKTLNSPEPPGLDCENTTGSGTTCCPSTGC